MTATRKHIIITGGGSGVGAATAHAFSKAGYQVTIMGRTQQTLEGQNLPFEICDVSDRSAVETAFDSARARFGPIQGVIANAGAAESVPFDRMTPDQLNQMMGVNLIGVVNSWQAALSDMKAAGWGRLIAIASTAGLKGYPYVSGYCAAKHAVIGLTKSVALELAQSGVTANAICPGFVETPLLDRSVETIVEKTGMSAEAARQSLCAHNPQKRLIQPHEVADAALWLTSDAAHSINGHALSLSGGEI